MNKNKKKQKNNNKKMTNKNKSSSSGIRFTPLGDRVLVKEIVAGSEEKTFSGIIIPTNSEKDSGAKRGEVFAVGEGKYDDGKLIPVSVSVKDTVLFQWGEKVVIDGEEYFLVREGEILGIVK